MKHRRVRRIHLFSDKPVLSDEDFKPLFFRGMVVGTAVALPFWFIVLVIIRVFTRGLLK